MAKASWVSMCIVLMFKSANVFQIKAVATICTEEGEESDVLTLVNCMPCILQNHIHPLVHQKLPLPQPGHRSGSRTLYIEAFAISYSTGNIGAKYTESWEADPAKNRVPLPVH